VWNPAVTTEYLVIGKHFSKHNYMFTIEPINIMFIIIFRRFNLISFACPFYNSEFYKILIKLKYYEKHKLNVLRLPY